MVNSLKTTYGARIYLYRANTKNENLSSTEYLPESQFQLGVEEGDIYVSDTSITSPIPIEVGTVIDDGTNTLSGVDGGNNSTENTTRFKPGANLTDNTAQNLNVNDSDNTKRWHISLENNINKEQYCGFSLFFEENVLEKITNILIKIGENDSNYYYKNLNLANLISAWNWINLGIIENLDLYGEITNAINYFEIEIITENVVDVWEEGEVVYDLLRQWEKNDTFKDYVDDFPQLNLSNLEVSKQGYITSIEAVGFNINAYGDFNNDSPEKLTAKSRMTIRSKSETDEVIYVSKDRIRLGGDL